VDNLWMELSVGALQRREIKQRCGLWRGPFDYNEIPTSSCQYVLLEGASIIRRAFFLALDGAIAPSRRFAM